MKRNSGRITNPRRQTKSISRGLFAMATGAVVLGGGVPSLSPLGPTIASAASGQWSNGGGDNNWRTTTNWTPTGTPGSITAGSFASTEDATFSTAGSGTINLGDFINIRNILFGVSGGNANSFTIGDANDTLNLSNNGGITINAGVANNENIGVAGTTINTSSTASAATTFTNNGTGLLTIAGNLAANVGSGNGVLNVTGSGNTTISGTITKPGAGNNALFKTGAGTLTLTNGSTWSGTGASSGGFSGPLIAREGTLLLNGGTHTVTGEAVVGGVVTNGGAGQNAKIQVDAGALNISAFLSVGRGNGTGSVSSDLLLNNAATVTAANFSAGYNGGSALNLPKGSITLNNTSSLTISSGGRFFLAESGGSNFTMTLNDSSGVTLTGDPGAPDRRAVGFGGTGVVTLDGSSTFTDQATTNSFNVGYQNGAGTLNVNTGTTFTTGAELRVAASNTNGTFTGSGTINVSGGTLNMNALTLARNNDNVASTLTGTLNLNSGTVNVAGGQTLVGWRGTSSSGTLNISGGSFNQATVAAANMVIGSNAGTAGAVNVSGTGALTLQRNSNLRFSDVANANATRSLTISGGSMTFYSDAGLTVGGTGVIDLMFTSNPTGTSTINLNGGTLTANKIQATSVTGTRVINFNGGTLKSGSSSLASTFLASGVASTANVRNGGAIFDSNGNIVTIGQALVHSTIGDDNATDGGLTKNGAGTLTLTGVNTYNGGTTISVGTLALGHATNTLADSGAVNVSSGTLDIGANSDTVGAVTLTSGSIAGTTGTLTGSSYDLRSGTVTAKLGGTASR
jgi:autotransporter-associated beta strand protein